MPRRHLACAPSGAIATTNVENAYPAPPTAKLGLCRNCQLFWEPHDGSRAFERGGPQFEALGDTGKGAKVNSCSGRLEPPRTKSIRHARLRVPEHSFAHPPVVGRTIARNSSSIHVAVGRVDTLSSQTSRIRSSRRVSGAAVPCSGHSRKRLCTHPWA